MWRKFTLTVSLCLLAALALTAGSRAKARTQQDGRESGVVNNAPASLNLRDFGAVGDGVSDDAPALQAALDALAAAGGGTLFVPEGRYAIATPVSKSFAGLDASVTIYGEPSDTPVPPPGAGGQVLTQGLDLKSEFLPRTTTTGAMLVVAGLRSAVVKDIAFVGTAGVPTDARVVLGFFDTDDASVEHCEFYGLSTSTFGSNLLSVRSGFKVLRSVFLGCTANSGAYTSVVQNIEWKSFLMEEAVFADYGQRPELFSKTGLAAPISWVEMGNAAALTNDSPRREAVFRSVFMDEGGIMGISSFPARYAPPSAPIDLIYVSNLVMNVSNLSNGTGHYLTDTRGVLIENAAYGWSLHGDAAIRVQAVGHAILDRVETAAAATRLRADAATARLTVIDSEYEDLASLAQQTVVIETTGPDQDPVQYVRALFQSALGRAPDAAAHFYWSDKILRCGADAACVATWRDALDAYLDASPSASFELTGRVTDEDDAPVAGVTIALTGSQTATTTTDAAGLYHFSNLPTSGVYTVTASKSTYNFPTPSKTVTTPAGDVTADFAAEVKRYAISGRVTGDAGVGLAGVVLTLTGTQTATATTDSNGNYTLNGVGAVGSYTLTPSLSNYAFTPAARSYTNITGNQTAQNFVGTSLGGLQYYPLAHSVRLLDTRPGQPACSTPGVPINANTTRKQVSIGTCGGVSIPATAKAVVGNAAVVNNLQGSTAGHLTLYPSGVAKPVAANVNYVPGQIVSNGFTVGLGSDGAFNVYAYSTLHAVVDITGYYAPPGTGGLYYHPLPKPVRLLDTRIGQTACDAPGSPIVGGVPRIESARTTCGGVVLPNDAQAIVGNLAVINLTGNSGFATVYPTGVPRPVGANVNYAPQQIASNAFTVRLGSDGAFNIFALTTLNVVVDVTGYYSANAAPDANGIAGLLYHPLASPMRVLDTRPGEPACTNPGVPLSAGGVRAQNARLTCGPLTVPASARAVIGNAAVVNTLTGSVAGHVILYPGGVARPSAANVNYAAGQVVSNSFAVGLGADGTFNIYSTSATHFVADVSGYFSP